MSLSVTLNVNGDEQVVSVEPTTTLLRAVRDGLGLTGSKEGCTTGACGVCTMLVDGKAVYSCLMLAASAQGHEITTIEGLGDISSMHPVQRAFVEHGAVQCGFCIPGMIMASVAFLNVEPNPTPEQIRQGLSGNFCRCTGYVKIVEAVGAAAKVQASAGGR
jgi:aerobic-type carbon monoxide dehydrogenase small subunit (CoxS/CutS family)